MKRLLIFVILLSPAGLSSIAMAQQFRVAARDNSATNEIPAETNTETFEPGTTLAIVGGHPIFVSDMAMEVTQILDQLMPGQPDSVKQSQRPELVRRLLPKYVDAKLLYVDVVSNLPKEADLEKIFESAGEQFDENVLPFIKKQSGLKSTAELDGQLRLQGSSLRLMRKSWTENELVKYMTKEKIDVAPEITREELLAYYNNHKSEMAIEAKAKWEQVMVRFDRFESRQEAKRELARLGNKIINGASFEAIAKSNSHGINAEDGGQYTWTVQGSLVSSELDKAIFELPLNELSDIIETDIGYHIVRVQERQKAGFIPFLEAQSEIKVKLVDQKREEAFQAHLSKLRETIPVELLID